MTNQASDTLQAEDLYKKIVVLLVKYDLPPLANDTCAKKLLEAFQAYVVAVKPEDHQSKQYNDKQLEAGVEMYVVGHKDGLREFETALLSGLNEK